MNAQSPLVAHDPGRANRPEIDTQADTQSDTLRSGRPCDSWTPLEAKVRESLSKTHRWTLSDAGGSAETDLVVRVSLVRSQPGPSTESGSHRHAGGVPSCHRERPSHRVPTGKEPFHERFVADHDRLGASPVAFLDGAPARTGMPYASNHPGEIGPVGDSRPPSRAARRTAATASEHGPRLRLAPRPTPSMTRRPAPRRCGPRRVSADISIWTGRTRAAHRQAWCSVRNPPTSDDSLVAKGIP